MKQQIIVGTWQYDGSFVYEPVRGRHVGPMVRLYAPSEEHGIEDWRIGPGTEQFPLEGLEQGQVVAVHELPAAEHQLANHMRAIVVVGDGDGDPLELAAEEMLRAGYPAWETAGFLGLEVYGPDGPASPEDVVVLPAWWATDGDSDLRLTGCSSGREAAKEYVYRGDWGTEPGAVEVRAWREALRVDEDGEIEISRVDDEWHSIDIEIEEEDAIRRDLAGEVDQYTIREIVACDHDWQPEDSGCRENPGVHSLGGTAISVAVVCKHCGITRTTVYAGSQRNPGEAAETVTYRAPEAAEEVE